MNLKRIVNRSFLALSISLSGYFLFFLSTNPIVQIICVIFAIMYELGSRYMLAAARTLLKLKKIVPALVLLFFYGIYLIYNILSGAGFFLTEISVQDKATERSEFIQTTQMETLTNINNKIEILTRALEIEVETGYRSQAERIKRNLEACEAEREALLQSIADTPIQQTTEKNPFRALAESLGVATGKLASWVWMMVMSGICVMLIVTSEELPEEAISNVTSPKKKVTSLPKKKKTVTVTDNLCACGCGKPRTGKSIYHSSACRTRAWRNKNNN